MDGMSVRSMIGVLREYGRHYYVVVVKPTTDLLQSIWQANNEARVMIKKLNKRKKFSGFQFNLFQIDSLLIVYSRHCTLAKKSPPIACSNLK